MNDHSELIQDYEITIESMQREIEMLIEKLNEPEQLSPTQEEYEKLENFLEIYRQDIEGHTADIVEEKKKEIKLKAEEEWVKVNSPEFQESKALENQINELTQKIINVKKERLTSSNSTMIEQIKKINPTLYSLIKRAIKVEQLNLDSKEEHMRLKQERKDTRIKYYKITQAFAGEEKLKVRLRETEAIVGGKGKEVDAKSRELKELQDQISKTKVNIQNVQVKKLLFEYNEVKSIKERLLDEKGRLQKEIQQVAESLEKTQKNPQKVTPSKANQNFRKEIIDLEAQIMEASKAIKEKEKEHLQAQFNYEEAKKQLVELQRPPEIVVRANTSRRVTIKDTPGLSSPERRSTYVAIGTDGQSSPNISERKSILERKSSFKVESPTSPEKRSNILNMVGKGMHETLTEQLAKALKGVGKPGQGIASKLLSVNRGDIVSRVK